jgi:uncharacterized protein YjbJ (UPF0337 family)
MAREDQMAGNVKRLKGKGNDVMGAIKGDNSQQAKGKVQQAVGKVQAAVGRAGAKAKSATRRATTTRRDV